MFFFFRIARRFVHLLYSNFTAKWRNQTVGDLFLKTAARVPDKVHKEKYNTKEKLYLHILDHDDTLPRTRRSQHDIQGVSKFINSNCKIFSTTRI